MKISVFTENRAEMLCCQEAQQMIRYLHNPKDWPLPVDASQFVADLSGEPRRWVEFVLDSHDDPDFAMVADALVQATIKVEAEEVGSQQ